MPEKQTFYITTPIYYVNGRPHIGHAYTTIAADTISRYQRQKGVDVRFLTGTDEHGQKVLQAAQDRDLSPKAHCDDMVVHWKAMMEDLQITYDRFIRTTDKDHQTLVTAILQKLWDAGEIYQDTYVGWYSTSAERFWTEKDLVNGNCPDSGQPVQKIEETNYFFKMSKYQQDLLAHIEANPTFICPESRKNEVLGFLRKPLGDLCISRPKTRMAWGIELPFDKDYVTYVWFDALLNYLTGIGYHPDGDTNWEDYWPATFQLIGKDILTTHSVYWTTMLMAMGVPLPKTIYAHGWWTSQDGEKMSKSLGNTIDISLLTKVFGLDATRYFLLREIAFGADGGFSYEGFLTRYNADLANDLGNLAHRALTMSTNWLGGRTPTLGALDAVDTELLTQARKAISTFDSEIEQLHYNKALEALMELVRAGNKYVDTTQPWALNKAGDTDRLQTVLRVVLELCGIVGTFLQCVMPDKSRALLEGLGSNTDHATQLLTQLISDPSRYNFDGLIDGNPLNLGEPLFPRFREMPEEIVQLFETSAPPKPTKDEDTAVDDTLINFDDFMKVQLRVGQVISAEPHPNADKLLVLKVDIGEETPRTIVAGIRTKFEADELINRKVVVVANLKPAKLRGVLSEGMLLAAGTKEVVDLVSVDADIGEVVR